MDVFILFNPSIQSKIACFSWPLFPSVSQIFAGDGRTPPAAFFGRSFSFPRGEIHGSAGASPYHFGSKLPEIIMEINDLREFAPQPQSTKHDAGGVNFSPLAANLLSQNFKERAPKRFYHEHNTIYKWECK